MTQPSATDQTAERRKREREEAEAHYAAALAAVERARPGADPRAALDEETLRLWQIVPADPLASLTGWRRRLAGLVWRLVGPMFQQQQQFNHVMANHLARPLTSFHLQLIHYLHQVSLLLEYRVSDGMSALADELAKRWESMVAREQRYEARVAAIADSQADIRATVASLQQATHAMRREMERVLSIAGAGVARDGAATAAVQSSATAADNTAKAGDPLGAYKYVGFEDRFRGSTGDIRTRLADYLQDFKDASDVLDVGCGRGEFLDLLREHGVKARGVDVNYEMAAACRERGLDVAEGDALAYLASLPDASLGGLFAAQVIEHLEPAALVRLLEIAFDKLRPGARVVLETINPACWAAFFDSYLRDFTHVKPVHPDTLKYLLQASGFQHSEIRFRAPYPEGARLQPIQVPTATREPGGDWALVDFADTFNANMARLNGQLFTYRDYAGVATRP